MHAVSAVFLPFRPDGRPDLDAFQAHLARTVAAGLEPALNMDTGFGPQLSAAQREMILDLATPPFVAGVHTGPDELDAICARGGTPIVFPPVTVDELEALAARCDRMLAFELGTMFSPSGRIFDDDEVKRVMAIEAVAGLKHSSLSRATERRRLALRDAERPDFRIYTGNDLAIDMIAEGSDYLLGLSTFEPEAFALRDRLFTANDPRWRDMNDALQALGAVAFREPVPAYKHSAAVYLGFGPHPDCPRRPPWEAELLDPFRERIAAAGRASPDA